MKFGLTALTFALAACSTTMVFAEDKATLPFGLELTGTAALTSDYRFRGVSQTESGPAVQAGLVLTQESGLYAGVWGSNVKFYTPPGTPTGSATEKANLELDPYLGYAGSLDFVPGKPNLDVGMWYYAYPNAKDLNWLEYYAKLGFNDAVVAGDNILATVNFTNEFVGTENNAWYFSLGYALPFGESGFGANATVGYTKASDYDFNKGKDHYVDWKAGITYSFKAIEGFTAELAAVGTNIDNEGLPHELKRANRTGAVFTLTKSF